MSKSSLKETVIMLYQLYVPYQIYIYIVLFISSLFVSLFPFFKKWQENDSWRFSQKTYLIWNKPSLSVSLPRQLKYPEIQPLMSQTPPLGSCFKCILRFSMFKASVYLPQLLWLYALLLHIPLDSHPEVSAHLLIS